MTWLGRGNGTTHSTPTARAGLEFMHCGHRRCHAEMTTEIPSRVLFDTIDDNWARQFVILLVHCLLCGFDLTSDLHRCGLVLEARWHSSLFTSGSSHHLKFSVETSNLLLNNPYLFSRLSILLSETVSFLPSVFLNIFLRVCTPTKKVSLVHWLLDIPPLWCNPAHTLDSSYKTSILRQWLPPTSASSGCLREMTQ